MSAQRGPGSPPAALSIDGLAKSFGGTSALDAISVEIQPGEIHGLVGQNGSGKSTLIKILSGYHHPDAGRLRVRGQEAKLPLKPGDARELGIEFVHQDLGLVGTMSVLENLRVGRYLTGRGGRIRWRAERRRTAELMRRFELEVEVDAPVEGLTQTEQSIVAIIRALQNVEEHGGGLLVLDEPTASLPRHEVHRLFGAIRRIAAGGSAVLIVTHNLDEVFEITDRVTVLRDGRLVASLPTGELDERRLIALIVGRDLAQLYPPQQRNATDVAIEVADLVGEVVHGASLVARQGEILGLTGLVGAGHDEIPYLLAGARAARAGEVRVDGRALGRASPGRARQAGVVLLPADRQRHSAILRASVKENVTLPALKSFRRRFLGLDHRRERAAVRDVLEHFQVRPPDPDRPMLTLSGGNQQRALLGRCLRMNPRVLLLHEPTQGVDVAARGAIFAILERAAEEGTAVVYSSVEYEELAKLCDRALIFRRGQIIAELQGQGLTHEAVVAHCYQTEAG